MRFLVDLGTLVPVTAVDGRDAFHMAVACVGGSEKVSAFEAVEIYQLDEETQYPPAQRDIVTWCHYEKVEQPPAEPEAPPPKRKPSRKNFGMRNKHHGRG
jgi:hypothetical protein